MLLPLLFIMKTKSRNCMHIWCLSQNGCRSSFQYCWLQFFGLTLYFFGFDSVCKSYRWVLCYSKWTTMKLCLGIRALICICIIKTSCKLWQNTSTLTSLLFPLGRKNALVLLETKRFRFKNAIDSLAILFSHDRLKADAIKSNRTQKCKHIVSNKPLRKIQYCFFSSVVCREKYIRDNQHFDGVRFNSKQTREKIDHHNKAPYSIKATNKNSNSQRFGVALDFAQRNWREHY